MNKYTEMQLKSYNTDAAKWSMDNRDPVVGSFDAHNNWAEYEFLFKRFTNDSDLIGLDFACGPGRNLVKYGKRFKRLDGVDISPVNIEKANAYTKYHNLEPVLYVNNGVDLQVINSETYDFVMSTIALQHICVHSIRYNLMTEFHRILKPNGIFTAQMGYGDRQWRAVDYYADYFEAEATNGGMDTRVDSPSQLEDDLIKIGFREFDYTIGQMGPGDAHSHWIYFSAIK